MSTPPGWLGNGGLYRNLHPAPATVSEDGLTKIEHRNVSGTLQHCPDCGAPTTNLQRHMKDVCAKGQR